MTRQWRIRGTKGAVAPLKIEGEADGEKGMPHFRFSNPEKFLDPPMQGFCLAPFFIWLRMNLFTKFTRS